MGRDETEGRPLIGLPWNCLVSAPGIETVGQQ